MSLLVRLLLDRGARANLPESRAGATALHVAAQNRRAQVVPLLLAATKAKADAGARLKNGLTALEVAASVGDIATVTAFLDAKPERGQISEALPNAVAAGRREIVELLLARGADVNFHRADGATPLITAVVGGSSDIVRLLIERKADVRAAKADGVTALHAAALIRLTEIATILLDAGADPNARKKGGYTPLHVASMAGATDVATLLAARGADLNAETDTGQSPADLAREYANGRLARSLATQAATRPSSR